MAVKRTSHAVYDTKYHLGWTPKYRKWILRGDLRKRVEELFREIAQDCGFEIDTLEVAGQSTSISFWIFRRATRLRKLWAL